MRMTSATNLAIAAAMLGGCAASPASIEPAFVLSSKYAALNCQQLAAAYYEIQPRLQADIAAQQDRRGNDIALGLLIGITPTLLNPNNDREASIANLKGDSLALQTEAVRKGCPIPPQ